MFQGVVYSSETAKYDVWRPSAAGGILNQVACSPACSTYSTNDVVGMALDIDALTFAIYVNGVHQVTIADLPDVAPAGS